MQRDIDEAMRAVASRATAAVEAARQELQARATAQEQEVGRRTAALEREREQLSQRVAALERDLNTVRSERDAVQRAATLEQALRKQAPSKQEHRGDLALRQHVAALEAEQAGLRNKFSVMRQDDLLRHVLSTTVDFSSFTVRKVAASGSNGTVLECDVTVPAWCVVDEAAAAAAAAGARTAQVAVAVKVLAGVENPRHTVLKHRFLREFHTLSAMPPHPNVITLLAFLTKSLPQPMYDLLPEGFRLMVGRPANPVLALIMPLLPRTLEAAAAGASPAQLLQWCLEVSAAVAHMWEYRWVHLDLKLNNVLVASDGRAVLTDMGTAMPLDADGSLTVPAHMGLEGNPAHRAPEVLASWEGALRDRATQVRMDVGRQEVWALGVLLHELVAGKHPYGEEYPLAGRDGDVVLDGAKLLARGLPVDMAAVLRRMVSRDPAARPANPAAAHAELVASVPASQHPAGTPVAPAGGSRSSAPPRGPGAPDAGAVSLRDVEQAYHASLLHTGCDPDMGHPMPNASCQKLQAWSERSDAARLCLALLRWLPAGGMKRDPEQARALAERSLIWCRGAAEGGEAVAQWLLGVCYYWGMGVGQDHAQAVVWFRRAAEQSHTGAQTMLGRCYEGGSGVEQARERAEAWYRRAAEQGYADGQLRLSHRVFSGLGVARDCKQGLVWRQRAAEQGHAEAQFSLGETYYQGEHVAADYEQAVAWYWQAAEQGHAGAQFMLGCCHKNGRGVAQDAGQAAMWLRRAATQGHVRAQITLLRLQK